MESELEIFLSSKDWSKFIDATENPPEPNDALKKAAEEFKDWNLEKTDYAGIATGEKMSGSGIPFGRLEEIYTLKLTKEEMIALIELLRREGNKDQSLLKFKIQHELEHGQSVPVQTDVM